MPKLVKRGLGGRRRCRSRLGLSIGNLLLRTRPSLVGARHNSEKGLIALPGELARLEQLELLGPYEVLE